MCKYHGWQYDLDGGCTFVQQESEFFDLDKADYGLVPVHCDVWAGFIFVNLDREPRQSLRDFLGPMITAMDDYPFHLMTERFSYTTEIYSNWKIYLDAFQEFYHASILHSQQQVPSARTDPPAEFYGAHYQIDGPHRVVSTSGWQGVPRHLMPPERMYPIEHVTGSGVLGPWHRPELDFDLDDPPGVNPGNVDPWGISNFQIFPNIELLVYERGWYLTYHYWPTSHNTHIWEGTYYFVPSANVRERVQHEVAAVMSKDYALQDAGTLAGTQLALESGVIDRFPLCDQEITVRHFHKVVADWVDEYRRQRARQRQRADAMSEPMLPPAFADLERFAAKWCLASEPERYAERMASSMEEMQEFYDACYPRVEEAIDYCDKFPLDDLPDDALHLLYLIYSLIMVSMPVEVWHQARVVDAGEAYFDRSVEPIP